MELKSLIEELAKAMVSSPDDVSVAEVSGSHVTVYELSVAKEDIGIVIGKGGSTAMAIRHILAAVGGKERRNIVLDIVE